MKKAVATLLILSVLFSSSCASPPVSQSETVLPSPTKMPTPSPTASPSPAPTPTPTPSPENLADANDLHVWIDDYVNAYGGTITVNGAAGDADQLLGAVKADPDSFIERKTIKGSDILFFVVNGVPLAIQKDSKWRAVLARDIADAKDARFAMPFSYFQIYDPDCVKVIKNANMLSITWDLDTSVVFKTLTTEDWRNILKDWENIKAQLDSGLIPDGISYNWSQADPTIKFAQENNMSIRAQHLVWNADVPDSIYNGGFTKPELLKILELTISVKLLKYKGVISEWDATDELIISQYSTDKWGFWQQNAGLWDVTRLSAGLIRKIDPKAKIIITDEFEMEARYLDSQPDLNNRFMKYVKTLKKEGLIDKVDIENAKWIYDMPSQEFMEDFLRGVQAEGIGLAISEIAVFTGKEFPIAYKPRKAYTKVDDPLKAQAEAYRRVVQAYINVGAYDIGLGDIGDKTSGFNYIFPGSDTAVFDNDWKPKMAWYEILKVMYESFL